MHYIVIYFLKIRLFLAHIVLDIVSGGGGGVTAGVALGIQKIMASKQ